MVNHSGQQFGNYRLLQLLGDGGQASVYLGQHIRLQQKQAAIKLLHAHLSPEDIEAFRQEADTIAALSHPNIVNILDFDIEQGVPFLVMDYYPDGTLRKRHPKGERIALSIVVSYIQQVAEALQHAHDQRVIHRDVKPANMLIDRQGKIVLSDFGIAAIAHSTTSQIMQNFAGTAPYMAPEQIKQRPRRESDQYALAIVIYEWLAGELPFIGTPEEIAIKHLTIEPPSLNQKLPDLPPLLEQVIFKALAKDPKERFATVQAFATAFSQAAQDKSDTLLLRKPRDLQEEPASLHELPAPVLLNLPRQPRQKPPMLAQQASTLPNEKALVGLYKSVQDGKIIDPNTIRAIAAQFQIIATDAKASRSVSFDAARAAQALYEWAKKNEPEDLMANQQQVKKQTYGQISLSLEEDKQPIESVLQRIPRRASALINADSPSNQRDTAVIEGDSKPDRQQYISSILLLCLSLLPLGSLTVFRTSRLLGPLNKIMLDFCGWGAYLLAAGLIAFSLVYLISAIRDQHVIAWRTIIGLGILWLLLLAESRLIFGPVGILGELLIYPLLGWSPLIGHVVLFGLLIIVVILTFRMRFGHVLMVARFIQRLLSDNLRTDINKAPAPSSHLGQRPQYSRYVGNSAQPSATGKQVLGHVDEDEEGS